MDEASRGREQGTDDGLHVSREEDDNADEASSDDEEEEDYDADDYDEEEDEDEEDDEEYVEEYTAGQLGNGPGQGAGHRNHAFPLPPVVGAPVPLQQMASVAVAAAGGSTRRFTYNLKHYPTYDSVLEHRFKSTLAQKRELETQEMEARSCDLVPCVPAPAVTSPQSASPRKRKAPSGVFPPLRTEFREEAVGKQHDAEYERIEAESSNSGSMLGKEASTFNSNVMRKRRKISIVSPSEREHMDNTIGMPNGNGMEPEDSPLEDDGEAEPTPSVQDDHLIKTEKIPLQHLDAGTSAADTTESPPPVVPAVPLSDASASSSEVPTKREEGITKRTMLMHTSSLDTLLSPLAELQRNTMTIGQSLRSHHLQYNVDLSKLVGRIDCDVTELSQRILNQKLFLSFMLVCSTFAVLSNDSHLWKGIGERTWDAESIAMQKPAHKSYKWLFECKKRIFEMGEIKVGKGSFVGEHNDLYQGEWKDNMRHGVGTALMQDGRRYDGEWESDLRSGFGIFRWPFNYAKNGGDLYAGTWKLDQRHGEGIYIWSDGTIYEGQWKEGKREGYGQVVWPDGRRYDGEYKDGKMSGKGTFRWPDGSVYVGEYKDGKRHGEGTYTYCTMLGGKYTGQWRNGMRDGWGTLIKNDGEVYQGLWKFNCPFGGVLTRKDGTVIEKFWRLQPPGS